MIADIYQQIGRSGIIHWDVSKTFDDHYTIGSGITMHGAGYASPYMADLDEKTGQFQNVARLKGAHVVLTRQKITSAGDFNELFTAMFKKDIKEVVVFCGEYEPNIVPDLIRTRAVKGFKTVLVRMPTIWGDQWFDDLALATGASIIDPALGLSLKDATLDHLGKVDHITVAKDDVFFDGIQDLSDHIAELNQVGDDESLLRASRLNTKTARYFVGAPSDAALSYKRLKVEDAIAAAYHALNGGIVAGGGVALAVAAESMPLETIGATILLEALRAPMYQIAKNAGHPSAVVQSDLKKGFGLDTRTGEYVNMFDAGIVDPTVIVLNAVRNAVSVAAAVIASPVVVTLPEEQMVYMPGPMPN